MLYSPLTEAEVCSDEIKPGESYRIFKKCVSISILNFTLFQGETDFCSCFHIREDTRNFLYTDKMEFHVIELPKLPEELQDDSSDLELWTKFIDAERKEVFDMLADKNPYIESAYQKLQIISQDKEKRLEYEAREKALRDYNEGLLEAEERGIAIGQEQGIRQGTLSIAKKLIDMGYPTDEIAKITLLSKEDIEKL